MNILSPEQRRGRLLLILLAAALLSGYLVVERRHMNADSLYYLIPARNFFEGRGLTYAGEPHTLFPPGYGFISYPFYLFIGDFEWTGALVSMGAYLALIVLAYSVSRYLYQDDSALLAACWVAIAPVILWHSYQALSDLVYAVLYISAYGLFLRIVTEQTTAARSLILGVLCGLLYLTRPEGLAVGGLSLLGLCVIAWRTTEFRFIGIFLPPLVLMVGAYILFLHDAEGQWAISGKVRQNIIRDEYVEGKVADYEDLSVGEFIQQQGWKYVQTTVTNLIQGTIQFFGINRHVFFVWGVIWAVFRLTCGRWLPDFQWDTRSTEVALVTLLFFVPIFAYPFFYIDYRFFIPHSVLVMIPTAFLCTRMLGEIHAAQKVRLLHAAMLLGLPVLVYAIFPFFQDTSLEAIYTEELLLWNSKLGGEWIADHVENPQEVMVASPGKANVIAFYAAGKQEHPFFFIDSEMTLAEIVDFMQMNRADYLVIERNYQATNPALWELWKNPEIAVGLHLLHQDPRFQVYELD